jgi:hypothetical protein
MKTPLTQKRPAYMLWFKYLQTAHRDPRPEVREALQRSKEFYEPWGDVANAKFDEWWKEKRLLFAEKYVVRQLSAGGPPADPEAIIVEIPLRQSPSVLTSLAAEIIREASANRPRQSKKGGKAPTSDYKLSSGAEPKTDALREMLTVYRDVYLKNPTARGKQLLAAVERHYAGRRQKRYREVPELFKVSRTAKPEKLDRVLRNLNRYIRQAEKIVLNVANGVFPGKY